MRYKISRIILLSLSLFVGIGAFVGGISLLIDPTGKILYMQDMLKYFKVLPFSDVLFKDYTFSGIALICVNGITNCIASVLILKEKKIGIVLGTIFGLTLAAWIIIQFIIFPRNFLSITYFILGLVQFVIGYITYVSYEQKNLHFSLDEYKNINKDEKIMVVYFSRTGATKKIAYEIANKLNACITEIKTKEKTKGILGFWWCGRFAMHRWDMELTNDEIDLSKTEKVIIVSPIWDFTICSPIRSFCHKYGKDINKVEYVYTHYMKCNFLKVTNDMDSILKNKRENYTSICVRCGKIKKVKEF